MELALRMLNASLDKFASMEHVVLTIAIKILNAHLDHAPMEHVVLAMELALMMPIACGDNFASMENVAMELAQKMTNAIRGIIATWILTNALCVDGCG